MVRMPRSQYFNAYTIYLEHYAYFPLVAAVLGDDQDGVVYADREKNPRQIYVEHAFGFAQIYGTPVPAFEQDLQRYLLVDKAFSATKVRLYTPHCPGFLEVSDCDGLRSWRQHFQLDKACKDSVRLESGKTVWGLTLEHVDARHVGLIEDTFGVVERFWRTADDFVCQSNGVLALIEGKPAALCYAAAVTDGKAEIDVLTVPAYRRLGLAKAVVRSFNHRCLAQNVLPLWDCFTNNTASMALCRSTGFKPKGVPYPFFTINR